MTSLIERTLRIDLAALNGYRPEGWVPVLRAELQGPVPPAAELVWRVRRPDGSEWIDSRVRVPELGASDRCAIELRADEAAGECTESGRVAFDVRLVSVLDGIDEPVAAEVFDVVAVGDDSAGGGSGEGAGGAGRRFEVDQSWRLAAAEAGFALDTADEPDAPRLVVSLWLAGEASEHELEAHLFHQGSRIARASAIRARYDSTANDGTITGRGLELVFDAVRGWNDLAASGWGGDWHLLDAHDGGYEVKIVRGVAVERAIPFEVVGGRLVEAAASYIGRGPASAPSTSTATSGSASDALQEFAGVTLDETAEVALQAFADRAERLLATWECEVVGAVPPFESSLVFQAEAVLRERAGYDELRDAVASLPDSQPASYLGDPIDLGALRTRTVALFAAAEALLGSSAQAVEDELAPFRAALRADKLAIFEDRPAPAFEYLGTDRHLLSTPAELAEAEFWFFEGALDIETTATVSGVASAGGASTGSANVTATTRAWTVLAHRFAPDHTLLDRDETRGPGPTAPLTAFRWRP